MKTILLYGDSNTWGFNPDFTCRTDMRYVRQERWGGVLQAQLGDDYNVLEEGLGGRTTTLEDPAAPGRSGLALLAPIVQSHQPIEVLVFLLGTNDMKNTYRASVADIRRGMELLLQNAQNPYWWDTRKPPKMLLISPTHIHDTGVHDFIDATSAEKSKKLAPHYKQLAEEYGCGFLDAATVTEPSAWEGLHLDRAGHAALGKAAAAVLREMLG
nr:GDSL-type esterase/lipase family protein [Ruthenibacterium lactatiformans]